MASTPGQNEAQGRGHPTENVRGEERERKGGGGGRMCGLMKANNNRQRPTSCFSHLSLQRFARKVCASLCVTFLSRLGTSCRILVLEAVPLSLNTIISSYKTHTRYLHCVASLSLSISLVLAQTLHHISACANACIYVCAYIVMGLGTRLVRYRLKCTKLEDC